MPPLEASVSPSSLVEDNRVVRGVDDVFTTAPMLGKRNQDCAVFSQRDVIIGTNPLYDVYLEQDDGRMASKQSKRNQQHSRNRFNMEWVEKYFNCMCVGPEPYGMRNEDNYGAMGGSSHSPKVATATKKYIVYPIAKYPARLNSPYLVEKRRKSLMKFTFQPVMSERE
jgi:hypothetical protein